MGEAQVGEVRALADVVPESIAPWWHTGLLLTELAALALIAPAVEQTRLNEPHLYRYTAGIMEQCLQLGAVVAGLYHRRRFFLDTLQGGAGTWLTEIWRGVALYIGTLLMFAVIAKLLQITGLRPHFDPSAIHAMAPSGVMELLAWLCLSVVVGFCEEHVFRGYLLKPLLAWAPGNCASPMVAACGAVVLTSALFGGLYVYEGVGGAILIGVLGAMYAAVALRRGNLRAVIVAHVLQDFMTAVLIMGRHPHAER